MILATRGASALAILLLHGCFLSVALAADRDRKPDKRGDRFQGMTSELLRELDQKLDLSDDQKEQIVALKQAFEERHREELRRLRERVAQVSGAMEKSRGGKDPGGHRKAMQEARELRQTAEKLRSEFERDLLKILTDEQRRQYEMLKKELSKPGRFQPGKKK